MSGYKPLVLGEDAQLKGDVTTNAAIGARAPAEVEKYLGFAPGRLAAGYALCVLKQKLRPDDFKFSGITLRSGGKLGAPAKTWEQDALRVHVSDSMKREYGDDGYRRLQEATLRNITEKGQGRIVKLVATTPHSSEVMPDVQYPMGGGGLQWTLLRPCTFLVAMQVDNNGVARTPHFSVFIGPSAKLEDRTRLRRYLDEV